MGFNQENTKIRINVIQTKAPGSISRARYLGFLESKGTISVYQMATKRARKNKKRGFTSFFIFGYFLNSLIRTLFIFLKFFKTLFKMSRDISNLAFNAAINIIGNIH